MTKFARYNKSVSIILISTCVIFILLLALLQWNYLTNINYGLHEFLAVLINAVIVLIPVEVIVWFIVWRRYRISKSKPIICNRILNIISVLSIVACAAVMTFYVNGVTAEGCAKDIQKYSINKGYYIKVDNKLIKISQEQYNQLENGKWYHFEFKFNKLIPDDYRITLLEEEK